jgi:hypothetical protein
MFSCAIVEPQSTSQVWEFESSIRAIEVTENMVFGGQEQMAWWETHWTMAQRGAWTRCA